jgi:tetratricopeptide (TPR) repeat protein
VSIALISRLDPDAIMLAEELDGLPLALATAGAYLDQVAMSLSDYFRLYKESWAKLQKTSPELASYEDRTLYSTWQLSFNHVEQQNKLSAQLLRLWAYFDNQDLWFELLRHGNSEGPNWILELTKDELSFHSAMRVLSDYGLIEVDTCSQELIESRGYSIHGCVHSWTIHVLNQEWDYDLARVAVGFVGSHVPGEEADQPWLTQRRLLQHAARSSYILLNGLVTDNGVAWIYHNLGLLYANQGKLAEAEKMYQRALQGYEKAFGAEHTSTLDIVSNSGNLYRKQGKLPEAEKIYQRVLQGYEKAFGAEHLSTLKAVNNLGSLYTDQGKLAEAEQMYQRALLGKEKALGAEHTSTLETANNLGLLYANQGKLAESEQMYQRALQGKEKALGAEHTSTLDTVGNLGNLYTNQGKLAEAEQMYRRALQGYEKAFGAEHLSTLKAVNNLGLLYVDQGKLAEAEQMYQRALLGMEKALGPEHTSTLDTVNNLGNLYRKQGKLPEAEKTYQRALKGYETALGVDDTTTYIPALNTISNLGSLFEYQSDLTNARIMYSRALVGFERVFGPDHPKSQKLRDILQTLDTRAENGAFNDVYKPVNNSQREISGLGDKETPKTKRHKLLKKLGLR